MREIVVVFTPPHYKVQGIAKIWMGRIDRAIDVARQKHCPLIVAGDANGGQDIDQFIIRAKRSGVGAVLRAFNGHELEFKNTRGDARAIARVMAEVPEDMPVVSESGIRDRNDMLRLAEHRVTAALIGESLMRSADRHKGLGGLLDVHMERV